MQYSTLQIAHRARCIHLQAGTMRISELLEVIATTPRRFHLPGTNLSSYSLSAAQYLEAVPSCKPFLDALFRLLHWHWPLSKRAVAARVCRCRRDSRTECD